MVHLRNFFVLLLVVMIQFFCVSLSYAEVAQTSRGLNGADAYGTGVLTTCADIRTNSADGKSVNGGIAGLTAGGNACFSGGGQSFCAAMQSYNYECAGATIYEDGTLDIDWPTFDAPEQFDEDAVKEYYGLTSRDENRGRAGGDRSLFMNKHGICREVDNSSTSIHSLFLGVHTDAEYRTIHGVANGGDPNGGYTKYANSDKLDSLGVKMHVCCAPVIVQICGQNVMVEYTRVGEEAYAYADYGFTTLRCAGNNNYQIVEVHGVCEYGESPPDGGSSGSSQNSGRSYEDGMGGKMSKETYDGLSAGARATVDKSYSEVNKDQSTNAKGAADAKAAEAGTKEEKEAEKTKEKNEEEAKAKEAEAKEADSKSDNDDDE